MLGFARLVDFEVIFLEYQAVRVFTHKLKEGIVIFPNSWNPYFVSPCMFDWRSLVWLFKIM